MSRLALRFIGLLVSLMSLGLSLYLTYRILEYIKATEGMWVIFWVNIPLLVLSLVISMTIGIVEGLKEAQEK